MPIIRRAISFSLSSSSSSSSSSSFFYRIRYSAPLIITTTPRKPILRTFNTRTISTSTAIADSVGCNSPKVRTEYEKKHRKRSIISTRSGFVSSASVHTTTTDGEAGKEGVVLKRESNTMKNFWDFEVLDNKGNPYPLSQHRGKVILVVNTASKCGFTPQFAKLEKLYQSIKEIESKIPELSQLEKSTGSVDSSKTTASPPPPSRFEILAFPCNQFGAQDPGTDAEINSFCQVNYGVTFPVLKKLDVNGASADPLWEWMKAEQPGILGLKRVKWNFEKFLIGPDGLVKQRWSSMKVPDGIQIKEMVLSSVLAMHGYKLTRSVEKHIRGSLGAGTIYDADSWAGEGGRGAAGGGDD